MPVRLVTAAIICALFSSPASAWNSRGHMAVAAVAWRHMSESARQRATALIKRNPSYDKWTQGVPEADKDLVAFVEAATWPDEIRSTPGYTDDGYTPSDPSADQNIGYADMLLHRYWHFKDIPLTSGGMIGEPPFHINAVTQISALRQALADPNLSDDIKSYDLSWLLHLVGDIHQPLHATSRFTTDFRHGDNGGNGVKICNESARLCDVEHSSSLHFFWDGAVGTTPKPKSAIAFAKRLSPSPDAQLALNDPDSWAEESFTLAKQAAYHAPVKAGKGPYRLDHDYRVTAGSIAERRIGLAGERMAKLLNSQLGN